MSARTDTGLRQSAARAGLITQWRDAFGTPQNVSPDTLRALLASMGAADDVASELPKLIVSAASDARFAVPPSLAKRACRIHIELENGGVLDISVPSNGRIRIGQTIPPGYHRVTIGQRQTVLAAAPDRCFGVGDATGDDHKIYGIAAQLYSLRRKHDFGYGDFGALQELVPSAARHGVAAIALSPVHAMFTADATKYSPYSPSNRAFLNTLCADVDAWLGTQPMPATARRDADAARRAALIDWSRSAALQRVALDDAFRQFETGRLPGAADFNEFRVRSGSALDHHAVFEALDAQPRRRAKPALASRVARTFADENVELVALHRFAQWIAARGLDAAQSSARAHGMPIGLIADFAVGVDPAGSECWSQPQNMLIGASIGAPPDELNALGQNWGLTTYSPVALSREGFAPFLDVLRAVMRHAGGVRLDHVMSLMRLWMIPHGAKSTEGAYLRYPFDDLVRLVALESWRHRCIVIGEDLGTVPDDCRVRLADVGILGLDVLPFMRAGESFVRPKRWRGNAIAMTSTHDVATVAGWWRGRDLDWRRRLQLFGARGETIERAERDRGKAALARAITQAKIARVSSTSQPSSIVDGAIGYVAKTAAPLALVPLEDIIGETEQPNLPGTITEHPNWRRRYRTDAARMLDTPDASRRLRFLARHRQDPT